METSAGGKEQVHSRIYWGRGIKQTDRWQAMAQEKAALSMAFRAWAATTLHFEFLCIEASAKAKPRRVVSEVEQYPPPMPKHQPKPKQEQKGDEKPPAQDFTHVHEHVHGHDHPRTVSHVARMTCC